MVDVEDVRRVEVVDLARLVVGDVEVQVAVAVGVGEREGRAPPLPGEARVVKFREAARAVAEEDPVPAPVDRNREVEVVISIDVGERGASRQHVNEREGGGRDLLEAPAAEVPVERARAPEAGEEEVRQAVPVDIPDRDALPFREHPVAEPRLLVDVVQEGHAPFGGIERPETAGTPGPQLAPPVSVRFDPGPGLGSPAGGQREEYRGKEGRSAEGRGEADQRAGRPHHRSVERVFSHPPRSPMPRARRRSRARTTRRCAGTRRSTTRAPRNRGSPPGTRPSPSSPCPVL